MKYSIFLITLFFSVTILFQSCGEKSKKNLVIKNVDDKLFLTNNKNYTLKTVDCTLSNGKSSKCYKITTVGITPTDHKMGPWCPEHTSDNADKGGIWFKDGKLYDVDGKFITELDSLYHDDFWKLHTDDGKVKKTETKEDCLELVNAQLVEKFKNYCIECLPEYASDIKKTYLIPITPVKLDNPIDLGGQPKGKPGENRPPKGPPPRGRKGPVVRGIAFNGVAFDAPAPTHIILRGYTIPPLDDAGGHINLDSGYHYHATTGKVTRHSHVDKHSAMIGYAMDGYGLYEQLNADGKEPTDLDECRGHYDDKRGYHYHVDAPGNNNFINCFSGAIAEK